MAKNLSLDLILLIKCSLYKLQIYPTSLRTYPLILPAHIQLGDRYKVQEKGIMSSSTSAKPFSYFYLGQKAYMFNWSKIDYKFSIISTTTFIGPFY